MDTLDQEKGVLQGGVAESEESSVSEEKLCYKEGSLTSAGVDDTREADIAVNGEVKAINEGPSNIVIPSEVLKYYKQFEIDERTIYLSYQAGLSFHHRIPSKDSG